jgi:hypothetical protein
MKKLVFAFLCMAAIGLAVPGQADAQAHVRRGRAVVRYHAAPRIGFYDPFFGPRWGYYGYYGYGPYGWPVDNRGSLRLQVEPKTAQVFVDGGYAGTVDQFDGHFQHLDLTPGKHQVEIQQPGFAPLMFQTYIQPGHTTDYKAALAPSGR